MKKIRYALEAIFLYSFYGLCWVLPLDYASALGGWLGRTIGPKLAGTRRAKQHLVQSMPKLSEAEQDKIILEMWNNLGRVMAEYPHLPQIGRERTEFLNADLVKKHQDAGEPIVLIAIHQANWEVNGTALYEQLNLPIALTYRAPNNPWADKLLNHARSLNGKIKTFPKARESGRHILNTIKNKGYLGILIDQKYNEGIAADFFGTPAKTNPLFITLTQKYRCPLLCFQCERLEGANFRIHITEALDVFDNKDNPLPVEKVIEASHALQEEWIKKNPGQWIWLHRRWDTKPQKQPLKKAA